MLFPVQWILQNGGLLSIDCKEYVTGIKFRRKWIIHNSHYIVDFNKMRILTGSYIKVDKKTPDWRGNGYGPARVACTQRTST